MLVDILTTAGGLQQQDTSHRGKKQLHSCTHIQHKAGWLRLGTQRVRAKCKVDMHRCCRLGFCCA